MQAAHIFSVLLRATKTSSLLPFQRKAAQEARHREEKEEQGGKRPLRHETECAIPELYRISKLMFFPSLHEWLGAYGGEELSFIHAMFEEYDIIIKKFACVLRI